LLSYRICLLAFVAINVPYEIRKCFHVINFPRAVRSFLFAQFCTDERSPL